MASAIDIINLALSHLGETPNVSSIEPPEGSAHAEVCARFYPIARDVALEMRNWSFAMKHVALAEVTNTSASWRFKYQLPTDCIRAIGVQMPGDISQDIYSDDFMIEQQFLFTNAPVATLRYLFRLTDTTRYPPLFVNAITWLLASYLAGPIAKSTELKTWCMQTFSNELSLAAESVANAGKITDTYQPDWIRGR